MRAVASSEPCYHEQVRLAARLSRVAQQLPVQDGPFAQDAAGQRDQHRGLPSKGVAPTHFQ
jgi:hypothetical protein